MAKKPSRIPQLLLKVVEEVVKGCGWTIVSITPKLAPVSLVFQSDKYYFAFRWIESAVMLEDPIPALAMSCSFRLIVPKKREAGIFRLMALINGVQSVGHFDTLMSEDHVHYRYSHLVTAENEDEAIKQFTPKLCEHILKNAQATCKRYQPAFIMVVEGTLPAVAFDAVSFDAPDTMQ